MRKSVDRSLGSLGGQRGDLDQFHNIRSREEVVREDVQGVKKQVQREGKFRFTAVTTHSNQVEVLEAVMEDGFYDAVLVAVNFRSPDRLYDTIEQAAAAGIGIIAMKTQNGGYTDKNLPELTPHQAALRYVINKPGIHVAVPGMLSRTMIAENLEATRGKTDLADVFRLEHYQKEIAGWACSFCSNCTAQCRHGVGGVDVARTMMYLEGYRDTRLARANGREVLANIKLCADCSDCTVTCSQGIDIKGSARQMVGYLA